jgi:L-cystine transport system permease protein
MPLSFELIRQSLPFLLQGAVYTILLSVGGMGFGLLIGFGLALMRRSKRRALTIPARVYISFIRGTRCWYSFF